MSRVSFHVRVVSGLWTGFVSCQACLVYGQGSTFVSCQSGLWTGSCHARVVSGLWAVFISCQGCLWIIDRVRFMPGWSMGSVMSCQGGLWAVSHVMPGWSMGKVSVSCQGGLRGSVILCQSGLWSPGIVHFMPGSYTGYSAASVYCPTF